MEKKRDFLISAAYWLTIAGIVYAVFRYAVPILMPFIVGFAVAAVLSPRVKMLTKRFRMKRKPAAVFVLLLFYAAVGLAAAILTVQLVLKLGELSRALPSLYKNSAEPVLNTVIDRLDGIAQKISEKTQSGFAGTLSGILDSAKSSVGSLVSDLSVKLISKLSGFAAGIPGVIVELMFAVISGFFFICDFDEILGYARSRLPKRTVGMICDIGRRIIGTSVKYLRSYAVIMLGTFAMLFPGLLLVGTENAFGWALAITLLDFLPVIGSGAVLLPWAVMDLIAGRNAHGMGLIVIWGILALARSVLEPKIVGKEVGLHPLATFISMFVGTKLFGFWGLILFPMAVSIAVPVLADRGGIFRGKDGI